MFQTTAQVCPFFSVYTSDCPLRSQQLPLLSFISPHQVGRRRLRLASMAGPAASISLPFNQTQRLSNSSQDFHSSILHRTSVPLRATLPRHRPSTMNGSPYVHPHCASPTKVSPHRPQVCIAASDEKLVHIDTDKNVQWLYWLGSMIGFIYVLLFSLMAAPLCGGPRHGLLAVAMLACTPLESHHHRGMQSLILFILVLLSARCQRLQSCY
ncbi:hypothetical protein OF83DRAFT_688852 [Amylostereum chailletii]|nr:hypothetical protein OF83DRAFT_688852 [Amylostereum chailletii]